ncbi:MAG: polyprenol monophosphomannose synthase [Thaumarchaeota archaeon]|nr:MAG: polyprenol monophosphomannose synthase [Nitrososphaerota archaeon]
MIKLAVVIPTYNEKDTLPSLIEELVNEIKKIGEKFFIIVMDDASPDGTGQIAEELNKKYGNITVIHRKAKLGLGSAYKEGFKLAIDKFELDLVIQMDADHSHDPKEIPSMIQKIQGYDFGIASRHVPGSCIHGWGASRKILHSAAGMIASICGGIKISDPTSGFRIFRKYVLDSINFPQIKSTGFAFQIEMLCYLKKKGFKGIELPTTFVNRKKGRSKMGLTEAIQFLNTCLILLMKRIRS